MRAILFYFNPQSIEPLSHSSKQPINTLINLQTFIISDNLPSSCIRRALLLLRKELQDVHGLGVELHLRLLVWGNDWLLWLLRVWPSTLVWLVKMQSETCSVAYFNSTNRTARIGVCLDPLEKTFQMKSMMTLLKLSCDEKFLMANRAYIFFIGLRDRSFREDCIYVNLEVASTFLRMNEQLDPLQECCECDDNVV